MVKALLMERSRFMLFFVFFSGWYLSLSLFVVNFFCVEAVSRSGCVLAYEQA